MNDSAGVVFKGRVEITITVGFWPSGFGKHDKLNLVIGINQIQNMTS